MFVQSFLFVKQCFMRLSNSRRMFSNALHRVLENLFHAVFEWSTTILDWTYHCSRRPENHLNPKWKRSIQLVLNWFSHPQLGTWLRKGVITIQKRAPEGVWLHRDHHHSMWSIISNRRDKVGFLEEAVIAEDGMLGNTGFYY